jgi:uncharacterized protein YPO0396
MLSGDRLQALRKELDKEKEEHATEIAKNEELQRTAEEMAAEKERLAAQAEELRSQNDALRSRAEALAQSAESLLAEKGGIQKQVPPFSRHLLALHLPTQLLGLEAIHKHAGEFQLNSKRICIPYARLLLVGTGREAHQPVPWCTAGTAARGKPEGGSQGCRERRAAAQRHCKRPAKIHGRRTGCRWVSG